MISLSLVVLLSFGQISLSLLTVFNHLPVVACMNKTQVQVVATSLLSCYLPLTQAVSKSSDKVGR